MTAIAVTIAGSDSGGGAGIQADLKTFSAFGVYGASVLTALTAQNTHRVSAVHDVPAAFVAAQIEAVYGDLAVKATKIGMLSRPAIIETVAAGLDAYDTGPVVLDPVMVAASGDPLIADEAVEVLRSVLIPKADLMTPNLPEAARLLGTGFAADREAMERQGQALLSLGSAAVLLKGGHASGAQAADLLLSEAGSRWFFAPRIATPNTHGTGCTLSSAIAASLARGKPLSEAVETAKAYIQAAIEAADHLTIGSGHGPVHHFHALWAENGDPL